MGIANQLVQFVDQGRIGKQLAAQYLLQSYGDRDWVAAIEELGERLNKNSQSKTGQQTIAFAVHLPLIQKTFKPNEEGTDILFRCRYFRQFDQKDWSAELQKIAQKDLEIYHQRQDVLAGGIITTPQYQPYTRQAYNWLCQMAEDTGAINEDNRIKVHDRHKKFVQVYGGSIINSIFSNYSRQLDKVVNWATPYFFERLIYQNYDHESIIKIKQAEFSKTSDALIQHFE